MVFIQLSESLKIVLAKMNGYFLMKKALEIYEELMIYAILIQKID